MINVAALRPSDIERLSDTKLSEEEKNSILTSVRLMLEEVPDDGGADADRIYMAAQMLDMAGVWDQVQAENLAEALLSSPAAGRTAFLEGLPHEYAKEVAFQMLTGQLAEPHPHLGDTNLDRNALVYGRGFWSLASTKESVLARAWAIDAALEAVERTSVRWRVTQSGGDAIKSSDDERLEPRARPVRTPLAEG